MKHFKQYVPLVIEEYSSNTFHYPLHHQNYYELIFISKGHGISHIENTQLPYKKGDLCFVSPEDNHHFEIHEHTTFIFVKFTNDYFKNIQTIHFPWQVHIFDPRELFYDSYLKEHRLCWSKTENDRIIRIIHDLLQYKESERSTNSMVVYFQLLVIFSMIHEHLENNIKSQFSQENNNSLVLNFIHQHIYSPEQLKIPHIANHFNISAQYFSAWFKQTYLITYKNYIDQYRIELLKNRLLHSNASFQSIADEFGFSDSSHFSNYFYRHTKVRPSSLKKAALKL